MKSVLMSLAALMCATGIAHTNDLEYITIREDGSLPPRQTNVLGTVTQLAKLQAQMEISAQKADQSERIYSQTTGNLAIATAQLSQIQSVGYADYYLVSFDSAMVIDSNRDKVCLYRWQQAPSERKMEGRESFDCYYAFKGTCDIQQLKQIFKVGIVGDTSPSEWDYLADEYVDDPVSLGEYTDKDGMKYNYSYRATVHLPSELGRCMLVIHIRDQAADTDGSVVLMHGGDSGGLTGVFTFGDTTVEYVGGRCIRWETAQ